MELSDVKKPNLNTVYEVADFMGISYHRVLRLIKDGILKATKIGGDGKRATYVLRPEDVQAYYDHISGAVALSTQEKKGEAEPEGIHQ